MREYLEISPRIKVLNERCRVFLDLAEILSDSIADTKMSKITWIIIALIVLSILVTTFEVGLRFVILEREKNGGPNNNANGLSIDSRNWTQLAEQMTKEDRLAVCGADILPLTYLEL